MKFLPFFTGVPMREIPGCAQNCPSMCCVWDSSPLCVLSLMIYQEIGHRGQHDAFITPLLPDPRVKGISKQPEFVTTALRASWSINLGTSLSVVMFHHKVTPAWLGIALKTSIKPCSSPSCGCTSTQASPERRQKWQPGLGESCGLGNSCFFGWQCQVKLCDSLCGTKPASVSHLQTTESAAL